MSTSRTTNRTNRLLSVFLSLLFVATSFSVMIPTSEVGGANDDPTGDEAVAWQELAPFSAATLVAMDKESYVDDFAYLAAVPTAVFAEGDKLYSSPVLFYEEPYSGSEKELTLNANQGIGYFMEDWHTVNGGSLETIQYINMPTDVEGVEMVAAGGGTQLIIQGDNIFELSADIATSNWEYSDKAVVAVVDDNFKFTAKNTDGIVEGIVPEGEKAAQQFTGEKDPDPQDPTYHNFTIDEGYKFITAYMNWDTVSGSGDLTDRGRDPDMQIYDWQLGEVAASENWNVLTGPTEYCESYIYHDPGPWGVAVTYMPTESMNPTANPFLTDEEILAMFSLPDDYEVPEQTETSEFLDPEAILQNPMNTARYTIDVEMFVGSTMVLNDESPFMGREATFTLDWEGSNNLGLIILGPSGATIASATGDAKPKTITMPEIGMGQYSVAAVCLDDSNPDVPFTIDYSWTQDKPMKLGTAFESAANGAVIASMENAPLLYMKRDSVPGSVEDALNLLGVESVILVGTAGTGDAEDEIKDIRGFGQTKIDVKNLNSPKKTYQYIRGMSGQNDIVFTTVNSFTQWYIGGFGDPIGEEEEASLYVGPAALAGAFHGAPVLVTDPHMELSATQAWHNEFWRVAYGGRLPPSVGCMVLTGHQIYDYLEEMGLTDPDDLESIVTVAGQFDIGTSWDRSLVGAAAPGRICGTPTDTAYWVARNGLYPIMIFANPSVTGEVTMTTGYKDQDDPVGHEVTASNIFLQTWVSYQHRFNERACGPDPVNNYWACDYVTADGITPYHDPSPEAIDNGVNQYGDNADGQYWPDLTISEIVPFYSEKLGYNDVYSTTFLTTMDNLNQGAILWFEVMHGGNRDGGVVGWWEPGNHGDDEILGEPWRGYETNGNVFEPDSVFMDKNYGLDAPYNNNPFEWGWHDGIIIAIMEQWHTIDPLGEYGSDGRDWDTEMENIHSVGFAGGSCLIANTYLHLSMVRHGSVFQIIDPWLTSWYCAFAIETFLRDIALGDTVGEAYEKGIKHVGVGYLTNSWWWDIFENVVYYGDPDLRIYAPATSSWEQPEMESPQDIKAGGHTPYGATSHPNEIEGSNSLLIITGSISVLLIGVGAAVIMRRKKEQEEEVPEAVKLEEEE